MEVIVNRLAVIKNDETHNLVQFSKTFSKEDLFCIPRVGDVWEESFVLDSTSKVEQVEFNYEKKECKVFLENLNVSDKNFEKTFFDRAVTSLKSRGWKVEFIEPTLEKLLK